MIWAVIGIAGAGIGAVVTLSILLAKNAQSNRGDLFRLIETIKDLADARRDIDGYKRAVESLEDAVKDKTNEADRERDARALAEQALGRALEKLAHSGDVAGAVASINDDLDRLSKMPAVSRAPTTEGGQS
jgi:uncharacterized protein HemX